jgi:hypothetical protein
MKTYLKISALLSWIILIVCSGCISNHHRLLSQNSDSIYIESTPNGADVLINNEFKGITPLTVRLPEDKPVLSMKLTKDGYETEEVTLAPREEKVDSQHQNMVINSTIFFGAVGLVAGLASGLALQGLGGGTLLGLTVGLLQDDKNLTTRYEYPQEDIHIRLYSITTK